MSARAVRSVALTVAAGASAASPEHKRFQTLLGRIDKVRRRLSSWQHEAPRFAEAYARRVEPLQVELTSLRRSWAFELETILLAQRWGTAEAACLTEMICGLSGALLGLADEPDPELQALHDRHADESWEAARRRQLEQARAFVERTTGVNLGDDPIDSLEELQQRARERLREQASDTGEPLPDGMSQAAEGAPDAPPQPRPRRPTAAQRRADEARKRIAQNLREVYRKLASALHPDRIAPDATAAQRASTTALMQRANAAYEAGDLLALLELQLQIEQVDALQVAALPAEQVRHFNRVLSEQLRELESEVAAFEQSFCDGYGYAPQQRLDPAKLEALLREDVQSLTIARARIAHDRRTLRGDMLSARRFLRSWQQEQRALHALRSGTG